MLIQEEAVDVKEVTFLTAESPVDSAYLHIHSDVRVISLTWSEIKNKIQTLSWALGPQRTGITKLDVKMSKRISHCHSEVTNVCKCLSAALNRQKHWKWDPLSVCYISIDFCVEVEFLWQKSTGGLKTRRPEHTESCRHFALQLNVFPLAPCCHPSSRLCRESKIFAPLSVQ